MLLSQVSQALLERWRQNSSLDRTISTRPGLKLERFSLNTVAPPNYSRLSSLPSAFSVMERLRAIRQRFLTRARRRASEGLHARYCAFIQAACDLWMAILVSLLIAVISTTTTTLNKNEPATFCVLSIIFAFDYMLLRGFLISESCVMVKRLKQTNPCRTTSCDPAASSTRRTCGQPTALR